MSKRRGVGHICDEIYCRLCNKYVPNNHLCFVQKHLKKTPEKFVMVFFDLECTQDTLRQNDEYQHVPNLCVSDHACNECITNGSSEEFCSNCEGSSKVFSTEKCVDNFLDFLDDFEDQRVICIAHNLSVYDGMFILNALSKREFEPEPIIVGWKIYRLKYKNIVFIDSLLFMPMALSKMPEAFDLGDIQKGYYPHFFQY